MGPGKGVDIGAAHGTYRRARRTATMRCRTGLGLPTAILVALAIAGAPTSAAWAQEGPRTCGTFEGIQCDGWVTDAAGILADEPGLEAAVGRVVARHGNQIALVLTRDSRGRDPDDFASDLGDAWGVGDADRDDGIVVLVDIGARRTVVRTGPGVTLRDADRIAGAGNSFFGAGDFDGGATAIVGSLEQALDAVAAAQAGDSEPTGSPTPGPGRGTGGAVAVLVAGGLAWGGFSLASVRRKRRRRLQRHREELVDHELERLQPVGHELPLTSDFEVPFSGGTPPVTTAAALDVLEELGVGGAVAASEALGAAWSAGLVVVLDADRLAAETQVPLELRASGERALLEDAVQQAAADALEVPLDHDDLFAARHAELSRLVDSLRPHRIAAARRRLAATVLSSLAPVAAGGAALSDKGRRFLRSGSVLELEAPLTRSVAELDTVYRTAVAKTAKLERLYEQLPADTTRPAVAAALADVMDDPEEVLARFERVRHDLMERGAALEADGLSIPAVAALLLMNNDEEEVDDFLDVYTHQRNRGLVPDEAVEYALAGLRDPGELERVRSEAKRLGLSVSVAAALIRRRDDGPEVYEGLVAQLGAEGVEGDSKRTIAAILAISLEPAQALRRWLAARSALGSLGLSGAYADVAASFGASDPRGPRTFALAYAAQRQALARSTIEDADRFAPELAHDGTGGQSDSWTGEPLSRGLSSFDPFTLLFYHWVVTRGHGGSVGWEPIYRDASWSGDRTSWWGKVFEEWGGGSFGGGGGGGSSWGGGGWGGGGFGGFGGGSFGGGGGGGSSW